MQAARGAGSAALRAASACSASRQACGVWKRWAATAQISKAGGESLRRVIGRMVATKEAEAERQAAQNSPLAQSWQKGSALDFAKLLQAGGRREAGQLSPAQAGALYGEAVKTLGSLGDVEVMEKLVAAMDKDEAAAGADVAMDLVAAFCAAGEVETAVSVFTAARSVLSEEEADACVPLLISRLKGNKRRTPALTAFCESLLADSSSSFSQGFQAAAALQHVAAFQAVFSGLVRKIIQEGEDYTALSPGVVAGLVESVKASVALGLQHPTGNALNRLRRSSASRSQLLEAHEAHMRDLVHDFGLAKGAFDVLADDLRSKGMGEPSAECAALLLQSYTQWRHSTYNGVLFLLDDLVALIGPEEELFTVAAAYWQQIPFETRQTPALFSMLVRAKALSADGRAERFLPVKRRPIELLPPSYAGTLATSKLSERQAAFSSSRVPSPMHRLVVLCAEELAVGSHRNVGSLLKLLTAVESMGVAMDHWQASYMLRVFAQVGAWRAAEALLTMRVKSAGKPPQQEFMEGIRVFQAADALAEGALATKVLDPALEAPPGLAAVVAAGEGRLATEVQDILRLLYKRVKDAAVADTEAAAMLSLLQTVGLPVDAETEALANELRGEAWAREEIASCGVTEEAEDFQLEAAQPSRWHLLAKG